MKRSGLSMAAMVATVVMVLTVSTYASRPLIRFLNTSLIDRPI